MPEKDILNAIAKLTDRIEALPKGYISHKTTGGKICFYQQWSEQGKKQIRYLHDEEIQALSEQIDLRKRLQQELRTLRTSPQKTR